MSQLWDHFDAITDHRENHNKRHSLKDIFVITLCGVICSLEHWTEIEDWAKLHEDWFKTFLDLPNGIPSHDTFGRVFSIVDPDEFEKAFRLWAQDLAGTSAGKHIAIDGKTVRGSNDGAKDTSAIHMVSAWVKENNISFGQVKVGEKTNEITAIPNLLKSICIKDSTVTIDAMGCQKAIARQIIEQEGDYILALKKNQKGLEEDVQTFLDDGIENGFDSEYDYSETVNKSQGAVVTRTTWVSTDIDWLNTRHDWMGLESVVCVQNTKVKGEKSVMERRYFICSHKDKPAEMIGQIIRDHWAVENGLHWTLDVSFNEDKCQVRTDHAPENLSRIRRMAVTLLKNEKTAKMGVKSKRKKAGYDHNYLLKVLGA